MRSCWQRGPLLSLALLVGACSSSHFLYVGEDAGAEASVPTVRDGGKVRPRSPDGAASSSTSTVSSVSPDFHDWLAAHGYDADSLTRPDLDGGSFGGRSSGDDTLSNDPVIFVHGNGDSAAGWSASIDYFLSHGYHSSELYATTWGPADPLLTPAQYHSKDYLTQIRDFIKAVKAYTRAKKVDVIAHSMGVTLARKAILGGYGNDALAGGDYDLGPPLTASVDTFVGIAGGNLGLLGCFASGPTTPTCGDTNGLYPGAWNGVAVIGRSAFLDDLLAASEFEGAYRYAIHSSADEILGAGGLVYGEFTARLPGQTDEVVFDSPPYGHFGCRDLTGAEQLGMVKDHVIN